MWPFSGVKFFQPLHEAPEHNKDSFTPSLPPSLPPSCRFTPSHHNIPSAAGLQRCVFKAFANPSAICGVLTPAALKHRELVLFFW